MEYEKALKKESIEHLSQMILIVWTQIVAGLLGISPVILAVVLSILYTPYCLFTLFGLFLTAPLWFILFIFFLEEYADEKKRHTAKLAELEITLK